MRPIPVHVDTGIDDLNRLLGGKGIYRGSRTLVRGQPGTGKTTLALQISKHLVSLNQSVAYIAADDADKSAIDRVSISLWGSKWDQLLGRADAFDFIKSRQMIRGLAGDLGGDPFSENPYQAIEDLMNAFWRDLKKRAPERWIKNDEVDNTVDIHTLVIIDSINALVEDLRTRCVTVDIRQILEIVIKAIAAWHSEYDHTVTLMLLAEDNSWFSDGSAESYLADVVINLRKEDFVFRRPVGMAGDDREWDVCKESQFFCQVLKGRGLAIQKRSCCYDFVYQSGIKMFPTYAANGLVSLFAENAAQREVIEQIRIVDVPHSYPGVVVQEFNQSAIQRMFSARRAAERVPPHPPLVLSHIDEYWVGVLNRLNMLSQIPVAACHLYSDQSARPEAIIKELSESKQNLFLTADRSHYVAVPQIGNVGMLVYRKDVLQRVGREPPQTWDELEDILISMRQAGVIGPFGLRLETRTFDSLLVTALELGWSHGAVWHTEFDEDRKLRVVFDEGSFDDLCAALCRLRKWIHELKIVPLRSSVDQRTSRQNWVFARHWYSTWIDCYSAIRNEEDRPSPRAEASGEFGILPIPVSDEFRRRCTSEKKEIRHTSCAGEWYLAIQYGSENVELGIDLINNLMSSRKVTERALSGAELPILNRFYESLGDSLCPGTDKSFNEVRSLFLTPARSRSSFAEYRVVARELHGVLQAIVTNPMVREEQICSLLLQATKRIDPDFVR